MRDSKLRTVSPRKLCHISDVRLISPANPNTTTTASITATATVVLENIMTTVETHLPHRGLLPPAKEDSEARLDAPRDRDLLSSN
jgi:hypothetical protein